MKNSKWDKGPEHYPSDRFDPAQAAFILDGYVDDKDIISLLISWGAKGYLKVQVNSGDIWLLRLKKVPEGLPVYQKALFSQIFKEGSTVKLDDLNQHFSQNILEAKAKIKQYFALLENHIYTMESLTLQKLISGLLTLPLILCLFAAYADQMRIIDFNAIIAIIVVASLMALSMTLPIKLLIQIIYHWHGLTHHEKITKTLLFSIYTLSIFSLFIGFTYSVVPLLSIISLLVTLTLSSMIIFVRKRTPQGQEWADKLLALKNFMLDASPEALTRLSADNPLYYFETLPYAYIMGISKAWSSKFEEIELPPAPWFEDLDHKPSNYIQLHESLFKHFNSISTALTSVRPANPKFGARHH